MELKGPGHGKNLFSGIALARQASILYAWRGEQWGRWVGTSDVLAP
jgi:hypothetical protein